MKIVYSVRLCRMHSGYLTSAHDGHFPPFDCCYLRTLESENVSHMVTSVVAKFHAFIINLNNSVFFWSITAGL